MPEKKSKEMKETKEKPILRYKLHLSVNEKEVGLKPFIFNTLGRICEALLSELKGVEPEKIKEKMIIKIDPRAVKEQQVKAHIGAASIDINDYVQEMIWKTITGFLSSLTGITHTYELLMAATITIDLEKRETGNKQE